MLVDGAPDGYWELVGSKVPGIQPIHVGRRVGFLVGIAEGAFVGKGITETIGSGLTGGFFDGV